MLGQGADVAERGEGQGSWEITYDQQISKYTEDNESKASHGEGSYIHRKGEG